MKKPDSFYHYGYDTRKPCDLCGKYPAKIDPRYGYNVCQEHFMINPVEFRERVDYKRRGGI